MKAFLNQLKDKTNIIIFVIVFLVLSSEIWVSALLGIITGNSWWYGVAATCLGIWLAPLTPLVSICVAITFGVRKIVDYIKRKKQEKTNSKNIIKEE